MNRSEAVDSLQGAFDVLVIGGLFVEIDSYAIVLCVY